MKNSLKNRIKSAYAEETPSLLYRIKKECHGGEVIESLPRKKKSNKKIFFFVQGILTTAACFVLIMCGALVGIFWPRGDKIVDPVVDSYIYLDVNPSIEIALDENDNVIKCTAINDDAEGILQNLSLNGTSIDTAINAIVDRLYVNGYLKKDSNSILVSVDGKKEKTETFLTHVTDKINEAFVNNELECSIIAQAIEKTDDLKNKANEHGISVGKMHLIDKMKGEASELDEYDLGTLCDLSIKELNLIYSNMKSDKGGDKEPNKGEGKPNGPFHGDVSTGNVGGYLTDNEVLQAIIDGTEFTGEEIESFEMSVKPSFEGGKPSLLYMVKIVLTSGEVIEFKIDCITGEIINKDNQPNEEGSDKPLYKEDERPDEEDDKKPSSRPEGMPEKDEPNDINGEKQPQGDKNRQILLANY